MDAENEDGKVTMAERREQWQRTIAEQRASGLTRRRTAGRTVCRRGSSLAGARRSGRVVSRGVDAGGLVEI